MAQGPARCGLNDHEHARHICSGGPGSMQPWEAFIVVPQCTAFLYIGSLAAAE